MSTEHDAERPARADTDEPSAHSVDDSEGRGGESSVSGADSHFEETGATDAEPRRPAPAHEAEPAHRSESRNMLPVRERRRSVFERLLVRLIATCGIVGIGVAIAAIMVSSKSQGWIIGLVVSIVTVVLSAILWSSRQL